MAILARKPDQAGRMLSADVEEFIRIAIQRGELRPGERLGSARQLAKQWKTSYGAVRQSLETLAAKGIVVRRPRAGTFVSADPVSSPSEGGARNIIGLLIPDIRMPDCGLIARHLQDAAHTAHLEVLISSTDNERERYDQSILRHLKAGVGGLVLVSPQHARISLEALVEIQKSGIPVANYARAMEVVNWPTVQTDVFQAVYLPIRHLCDLGRKKLAFLSYPLSGQIGVEMHYGLYRALADSGLATENITEKVIPADLYLNGWSDNRVLRQLFTEWLNEHRDVDAICCMHDHIAAAVLGVLAERGVRVPDDIAVTGHGSMPEAFGIAPGDLTTVDTCIDEAMHQVVHLLLNPPNCDEDDARFVAIQPRLVIGRSTVSTGGSAAS